MILASVLSVVFVAAVILLAAPAVVAKGAGIQKGADSERKLQRGSKVISGFELIHAATGQKIVTLVNGTVIDMSTLVPRMAVASFSIRAVVSRGAATASSLSNTAVSIEFLVLNQSRSVIHVASSPPYARCGQRAGTKYVVCSDLGVGRHSASARLFPCPRRAPSTATAVAARRCRATSTYTVSFTIKRGGISKVPVKAPVKAPVKVPVKKPVKAPVKVPVKAPLKAPVKAPVKVPVQRPVTTTAPTPIVAYPTCRDTLVRSYYFFSSFVGHMLSLEGRRPEDFALQWLYYNDTTIPAMNKPSPSRQCTGAQMFRLNQRFALLTLWFQQTRVAKTNSSSFWDWDAAWLKGDECDKDEATFDTTSVVSCTSMDLGGSIGRQNVVTSIDIRGRGIYGTLPDAMAHLSHIKYFWASDNALTGSLPALLLFRSRTINFRAPFRRNSARPGAACAWRPLSITA